MCVRSLKVKLHSHLCVYSVVEVSRNADLHNTVCMSLHWKLVWTNKEQVAHMCH